MRKGKTLWTQNPQGELITYLEAADADEEAMFVAERILAHAKAQPHDHDRRALPDELSLARRSKRSFAATT